jgi:hypothetical protein
MKQYMTVPAPQGIAGKGANAQQGANTFAQIINQQAAGGWHYHSMEEMTIVTTGCAAMLKRFIGHDDSGKFYMLIFERDA